MSDAVKLYSERDTDAQGDYYFRHLSAMTGEGLHSKSAIAAELAHRDMLYDQSLARVKVLTAELSHAREALQEILDYEAFDPYKQPETMMMASMARRGLAKLEEQP